MCSSSAWRKHCRMVHGLAGRTLASTRYVTGPRLCLNAPQLPPPPTHSAFTAHLPIGSSHAGLCAPFRRVCDQRPKWKVRATVGVVSATFGIVSFFAL